MSAWTGKPCPGCDRKKSPKRADLKYCYSCSVAVRKANREAAHAAYILKTYGISGLQYKQLLEFQGGACYMCRRAKGKSKRLAVDHDHACCPGPVSCGKCIRGLLCGTCNKIFGHARDDREFFIRGIGYLDCPPWKVLCDSGITRV